MERIDALAALGQVEELRATTRSVLSSSWHGLAVFGGLALASVPVCELAPLWALGVYWLPASIFGMIVVARIHARGERERGVEGWSWPYVATGGAIIAGASSAGAIGGASGLTALAETGPYVAVAAGYLVFALLDRRPALAAVAAALGAAALAVGAAGTGHACALLAVLFGAASLALAGYFRHEERARG